MKFFAALGYLIASLLLFPLTEFTQAQKNASAQSSLTTPNSSYVEMFEEMWHEYDVTYPYFDYKHINWDSLRREYRPKISACESDSEFITQISRLLSHLRDFHVGLRLPDGTTVASIFDYARPIRYNMEWEALLNYMPNMKEAAPLFYSRTPDNMGYIVIPSWSAQVVKPFYAILEDLRDTRALIIDIRMNVGGSEFTAQEVASRFATHTAIYALHRFREGERHDVFGPPGTRKIAPSSEWRYTKPVMLLTGVITMSSSESFVLMMKRFSQVTTVGEPTRGCSGNPVEKELPNGIKYSVPRWRAFQTDNTLFEGRGLEPDIYVEYTESHRAGKIDPVFEKAKELVDVKIGSPQVALEPIPTGYKLEQNYPNPFNSSTIIKYSLEMRSDVILTITNALGQGIYQMVNESQEAGSHVIEWHGRDSQGSQVTSGVYFFKIQANEFNDVRKMILLR